MIDRQIGNRLGERAQQVIELVAGARRLGSEVAAVVGVHGPMQRDASHDLDPRLGEAVELRRVIGEEPDLLAAEETQHAAGNPIAALIVVEAERLASIVSSPASCSA